MSANRNAIVRKAVGPGILLVLLTVLISGVSNFVNFYAVGVPTSSDAFVTARNLAVAVLLLPFALFLGRTARAKLSRVDWLKLGTVGLIGGAIPFLLFFRGLQMAGSSGAATATFGYRTLFLMASVLGVVFLQERLSGRAILAAGLLLVGSALLLTLTGPIWTDGTGYVLLATTLWAGEYTLSKHTLRTLPSGTVALARMGFGGAFLLAYLAVSGQILAIGSFGGTDWLMLFLSALLLFGFVSTWYAGLKTVDLSVAASLLVLAFPITWALGFLTAKSTFTVGQAAGIVAIVVGAVLVVGLASLRDTWRVVIAWVHTKTTRAE